MTHELIFIFKHSATKFKKTSCYDLKFFDSQIAKLVSNILYICLSSHSNIWVDKLEEA